MRSVLLPCLLLIACATVAVTPATRAPDWAALADESTVVLVTRDADGDERVTTVWLVVVDGEGFIRTGATRWFANLERDPRLGFRAAGSEYPLAVEFVRDPEVGARVDAAFRAKYGFANSVVTFFRRDPKRMRLVSRSGG